MAGLLIVALITLAVTMVAKRLSSTIITVPMIFIGLGAGLSYTGLFPLDGAREGLHIVAELALIILLFLDAAKVNLSELVRERTVPMRMLLIGLPLAILLGTVAAWALLPGWSIFAIALVAAILAPTDAALGQPVITDPTVPEMERQSISVESGLNDGLALPSVLLFASLAAATGDGDSQNWPLFIASQLTLGPLIGVVLGYLGGKAFVYADTRGLSTGTHEGVGALALAGGAYIAATLVDGNGFIAAFVAGLAFGHIVKGRCDFIYEFTESEGQLLSWGAFFLLGLILVPEAVSQLDGPTLTLILLSLFVIRPLAIWLSLAGTGLAPVTKLFFGWFGPRGLATALFALIIVERTDPEYADKVLMIAINAVWISALLHGLSAAPGARWYGRKHE
ncbi:cation:proton antiporter [Kordiimonas aestuarii]|uniref:cation:proton antiporter n=1 Tax=Kordiimonas aestuarii TaxID=1005925 RepID=UPI0021D1D436|nr:cation:proton antiporter [Kordiimonas aestuarii]